MIGLLRRTFAHPALAGTLLWGLLELIALQRPRRTLLTRR